MTCVVSSFLQVHVSIQDQSCPSPRVHGYSQPFFLGYPQVVGAIQSMRGNMSIVKGNLTTSWYCIFQQKGSTSNWMKI